MSGSDKGRGRGRGARKVKIPNEPDKESLDKINQEKGVFSGQITVKPK